MAARRFLQAAQKAAHVVERRATAQPIQQLAQPLEVRTLDEPLLTVRQVAVRLVIPEKSVYDQIHEHGLPIRRVGRSIRIHQDELEAWTRRNRDLPAQRLRVVKG